MKIINCDEIWFAMVFLNHFLIEFNSYYTLIYTITMIENYRRFWAYPPPLESAMLHHPLTIVAQNRQTKHE